MLRFLATTLLLLGLLCGPTQAQLAQTGAGLGTPAVVVSGYTGLGDLVAGAAGYYDCTFAYSGAYAAGTGKLCQVKRALDNETCDLLAATTGGQGVTANCSGVDTGQSLSFFLTATTGTWTVLYDQSGNAGRNMTVVTGAAPGVNLSLFNSLPGMTFNGTTQFLTTASINSIAQPTTMVAMGQFNSGAGNQGMFQTQSNSQFLWNAGAANSAGLGAAGGGVISATASNAAGHVFTLVFNGASPNTTIRVDDTAAVTGTSSASTATGSWVIGALGTVGLLNGGIGTLAFYPSAVTGTNATALCHNLRLKWATPGAC